MVHVRHVLVTAVLVCAGWVVTSSRLYEGSIDGSAADSLGHLNVRRFEGPSTADGDLEKRKTPTPRSPFRPSSRALPRPNAKRPRNGTEASRLAGSDPKSSSISKSIIGTTTATMPMRAAATAREFPASLKTPSSNPMVTLTAKAPEAADEHIKTAEALEKPAKPTPHFTLINA
ncbi:hypothetical protein HRG_006960 [Hirsutella rhossiliensis]|uniref:Uncharacterized protein n=1 Tax=Hirsutella rhossiliensis TaxID=111463 RepID=A0A9P8SHS8_9HYPO|nr:uncharacterized protein HRG_06960 [Hirsutella rhossiliensis]KAH0961880.1 hypothetical protein HRG_06960 [Hirsutella rhossiliensis]